MGVASRVIGKRAAMADLYGPVSTGAVYLPPTLAGVRSRVP